MSTPSPLSPQSGTPPPAALLPLDTQPAALPVVKTSASDTPAGGARKLSRWEELEEVWIPEEIDFTHSGINE